jgi:hypothetical protein
LPEKRLGADDKAMHQQQPSINISITGTAVEAPKGQNFDQVLVATVFYLHPEMITLCFFFCF